MRCDSGTTAERCGLRHSARLSPRDRSRCREQWETSAPPPTLGRWDQPATRRPGPREVGGRWGASPAGSGASPPGIAGAGPAPQRPRDFSRGGRPRSCRAGEARLRTCPPSSAGRRAKAASWEPAAPSRSGCTTGRGLGGRGRGLGGEGRGGAWVGGAGSVRGRGHKGVRVRSKGELMPVAPWLWPQIVSGRWRAGSRWFGEGELGSKVGRPAGLSGWWGDSRRSRTPAAPGGLLPGDLADPKAGTSRHPGS